MQLQLKLDFLQHSLTSFGPQNLNQVAFRSTLWVCPFRRRHRWEWLVDGGLGGEVGGLGGEVGFLKGASKWKL